MAIEDLSDDEKEDYFIKDTDALIVAGKIVPLHLYRKKTIQAFKSISMSSKGIIYSFTMKSCSQLSLSISNGSRLILDQSIAPILPKETMP